MQRLGAIARAAAFWALWVLCVLMILPALLSVPGKPTDAEATLYLAVLMAVTGYPIALPILTVLERRALRRPGRTGLRAIRVALWGCFFGVLAVLGTLGMAFYRHDQAFKREVAIQNDAAAKSYIDAIGRQDTRALEALIAEDGGVEPLLQPYNQTPVMMAANHGHWSLVLFLLEHGANPDRPDALRNSVRSLVSAYQPTPDDPADAAALERIRARLAKR